MPPSFPSLSSSDRGGVGGKLSVAFVIARATLQAGRDMKRRGVALRAGFGGYPSFAPAVAAKSLQLPLLLHEQATRLSMANRRLLAYADALATSFPNVVGTDGFDPARVTETGNLVPADILAACGDYPALSADTPIDQLAVGGSQAGPEFGDTVTPAP